MNEQEYMNTLLEQIGDKRAKVLVMGEIKNHIEEQTECYESQGKDHETALKEAVNQMGDPIDVGCKLNKIHRPKMPIGMMAIVLALTLFGIIMQCIIFRELNSGSVSYYISHTIVYNIIGFVVIGVLLFWDYTFIAKYAYALYGCMIVALILFSSRGAAINGHVSVVYFLQLLLPIILAALIYRNRNREVLGLLRTLGLGFFVFGLCIVLNSNGLAAVIEGFFVFICVVLAAIWKGIFGNKNKVLLTAITLVLPCALVFGFYLMLKFSGAGFLQYYQQRRIEALLHPYNYADAEGYIAVRQRDLLSGYSLFGNNTLPWQAENSQIHQFIFSSIFSYFGVVAGAVVIVSSFIFCIKGLLIAWKQSNRIGMLVGTVCSASILIHLISALGINFGFYLWSNVCIPFLTYGLTNTVVNAIYVGLILCVYRNKEILSEQKAAEQNGSLLKIGKYRIAIEKTTN